MGLEDGLKLAQQMKSRSESRDEPKPSLLVRKLAEVMGEVSHVPKSGHNQTQNYDYATEADVLASVRAGLAKRHVVLTPRVEKLEWRQIQREAGKAPLNVATVHMTFCAHDGETGEVLEVASTVGEGMDSGDKAVFKAMTGATKYAVLKLFLIPTGDDPEADGKPEPRQRQQRSETRPAATPPANGTGPTTFPNFGKAKGQPIRDATMGDLESYAKSMRESIANPEKKEWAARNSAMLGAIEKEIARQRAAEPVVPDRRAYLEALDMGIKAKWTEKQVGVWMKEQRKRGGAGEVVPEDVVAFREFLATQPPGIGPT